jgi:hypothetical protein
MERKRQGCMMNKTELIHWFFVLAKRLYRRARWFCIYQWESLTLKQWPYESCKVCGKAFRLMWGVEDYYWRKIVGVSDSGGGSWCLDCFLERARHLDINVPESAISYRIFDPEG